MHGTWESIKKFAPYFRNYKRVLIFDLACAFFATAADLAFPRFVGIITGTYLPQHDFTSIVYIALLIILFKAVTVAANYYITKYGHIMGANIEKTCGANSSGIWKACRISTSTTSRSAR